MNRSPSKPAPTAAIGLTQRKRSDSKYQNPSEQVRVKKGPDRIQVVQMDTED